MKASFQANPGSVVRFTLKSEELDILVTSAWGGPRWRWDVTLSAGVRPVFVASQLAAQRMVSAGRGLIVHISYWAAQKYIGNVLCVLVRAATDKIAADAVSPTSACKLRP